MGARDHGQAGYRVPVNPHETAGLADATILVQVLQDRDGLVLGEFAAVQGRALALREAALARPTGQDAAFFLRSVPEANPQVVQATLAVVGAIGIQAAEVFQVVHGSTQRVSGAGKRLPAAGISVESS